MPRPFDASLNIRPAAVPGGQGFFRLPTEAVSNALEDRFIGGEKVPCVILDSVQSQANRMELTLLEAIRASRIELPVIEARFEHEDLLKPFTVTSLEAPHRIADAIFRG